jgi:hypothetical protein
MQSQLVLVVLVEMPHLEQQVVELLVETHHLA